MIKIILLSLGAFTGGSLLTLRVLEHPAPEVRTELVQQVERSGAGNIDNMSMYGLMSWFESHHEVALEIAPQCAWLGQNRTARWNDSLEGRLCRASGPVASSYTLGGAIGPGKFTAAN